MLRWAKPSTPTVTHFRVRRDKVDHFGRVTLRYLSRLRHIHVGCGYKHWPVRILVAGAYVRVVTEDGQLLRELTIDPARDYQPLGGTRFLRDDLTQASGMT